jgi:hypothetical protein
MPFSYFSTLGLKMLATTAVRYATYHDLTGNAIGAIWFRRFLPWTTVQVTPASPATPSATARSFPLSVAFWRGFFLADTPPQRGKINI